MIRKSLLLIRTVRHLKFIQLFYQIFYRLKVKRDLSWFVNKIQVITEFRHLVFDINYTVDHLLAGTNRFCFLNLEKDFGKQINWNYQGHGKLWNYNLQYCNYLHQPDISISDKQHLLSDLNRALKAGILALEPYPVALRTINTIRFLSTNKVTDQSIVDNLFAQLAYLNNNVEYHLLGNHLLEDAFALFMGGHAFENARWLNKGKHILYKQLNEQVLEDGAHFELSPMYHQIVLFRVLELIDWYSHTKCDVDFLNFMIAKASDMLGWLKHITFTNGEVPYFNDSAPGVTFTTSQLQNFARIINVPVNKDIKLDSSGYRKFVSDNFECVVDVGQIGPSYQPGHGHADALSFVLYVKGVPLIVDTGTSTYQTGKERQHERSTEAHNTVAIQGKDQSEVWGGFRVGRRAKVTVIEETNVTILATHDGYLSSGIIHKRRFYFTEKDIQITDILNAGHGQPSHALFHFHPHCAVKIYTGNQVVVNGTILITFAGHKNIVLQMYKYANGYNKYLEACCIKVDFTSELVTTIGFIE